MDHLHYTNTAYVASSLSQSTENTYYLAFKRYEKFCLENQVKCLPAGTDHVSVYFIKLAEEHESISPVCQARSAIRHFHLIAYPNLPSPTDDGLVQMVVDSIMRKYSKPVNKMQPITLEILRKLLDSLIGEDLRNKTLNISIDKWRLAAKSVVKFFAIVRYEEVVELRLSDFHFSEDGDVEIIFSKANNPAHSQSTL